MNKVPRRFASCLLRPPCVQPVRLGILLLHLVLVRELAMASASRRIPSVRPASTEGRVNQPEPVERTHACTAEIECWTQAASKLTTLSQVVASTATSDTLARVNRLLSAWPINDELPPEGLDGLRSMARKLETGMQEIKKNAENEAKSVQVGCTARV
jgi:hypothetical protein